MSRWTESVERRITASPDRLYDLVADPTRHPDLDGSGSVVEAIEVSTAERPLGVGDQFTMSMNLRGRYSMTSTVVEAVRHSRFAWQSYPHRDSSRWRSAFGGRIWRYEFEPVDDGATLVRETWDLGEEPLRALLIMFRGTTRNIMIRSLERMAAIAEP